MKQRINDFIDLFPTFHRFNVTDQILHMIYFHAVEEGRESANSEEIETLFRLAGVARPKNLPQMLGYLSGKGAKLLVPSRGEYELRREVRQKLTEEIQVARGTPIPVSVKLNGPFDFNGRTFTDHKIAVLIDELRRCHALQCWNACGLLMRIIIERTVDTVDPSVKAKTGLKDKLNKCRDISTLGKSVRESIDHLHSAKIIGDIAAHDSKIVVDEPDVNLAAQPFRILLKSVATV